MARNVQMVEMVEMDDIVEAGSVPELEHSLLDDVFEIEADLWGGVYASLAQGKYCAACCNALCQAWWFACILFVIYYCFRESGQPHDPPLLGYVRLDTPQYFNVTVDLCSMSSDDCRSTWWFLAAPTVWDRGPNDWVWVGIDRNTVFERLFEQWNNNSQNTKVSPIVDLSKVSTIASLFELNYPNSPTSFKYGEVNKEYTCPRICSGSTSSVQKFTCSNRFVKVEQLWTIQIFGGFVIMCAAMAKFRRAFELIYLVTRGPVNRCISKAMLCITIFLWFIFLPVVVSMLSVLVLSSARGAVDVCKDCLAMTFLLELSRILQVFESPASPKFKVPLKVPVEELNFASVCMVVGCFILFFLFISGLAVFPWLVLQFFNPLTDREGLFAIVNMIALPVFFGGIGWCIHCCTFHKRVGTCSDRLGLPLCLTRILMWMLIILCLICVLFLPRFLRSG